MDEERLKEDIAQSVIAGDLESTVAAVGDGLEQGLGPQAVIDVLIDSMSRVAALWNAGEMFIPEVVASARAMQAGQDILRPLIAGDAAGSLAPVVIGTVKGDLHDIGKNLVKMMLEGGGFSVFDVGVNAPPEAFVGALREHNASILCMSALLTTTVPEMKVVIDALSAAGLRERTKVVVGGACVTADFAKQIGADGYGSNAAEAVSVCKQYV
jgi:5-methyltetrahydrofolate--homocysteine methyltransferase